jgi:adhesin/invasin
VSTVSVTFTVTGGGGTIVPASPATIATDVNGLATLTSWTLGTTAGVNTLTATSGSLSGSPVTFTATGTAGTATQIAIQAGNGQSATVNPAVAVDPSVIARDAANNPVSGVSVTFTVTGGGASIVPGSPATIATDVNGLATLTSWTLGTVAGANALQATATGLAGSPLTFTATGTVGTVSAAQSLVSAAPGAIAASSGTTISTITVTARDPFNNLVQGATVVLAATGTGNSVTQPVATTNGSGVATGTLSATVAEAKTVFATINGVPITQTAAVTVTPAAVSAAQSTVSASPGAIAASSGATTSTITVTARDPFNNLIAGATVVLAATGTGNTLTQPVATTNGSGVATGTLSATLAEAKTVAATINGVPITQTAAVTVDPAAASELVFTQQPSDATTSTDIAPPITVAVRDAFGNTVTGFAGSVTMTIENDAGALTALTGTNPATVVSGVATFGDLRLDQAGVGFTLRATAGALFVISSAFTIL